MGQEISFSSSLYVVMLYLYFYFIFSSRRWNYLLEDGFCTDSMAFETCYQFGLPDSIIQRAAFLSRNFENFFSHQPCNPVFQPQAEIVYELDSVAEMLRSILRNTRIDFSRPDAVSLITDAQDPPASLEGSCCVYVLLIKSVL